MEDVIRRSINNKISMLNQSVQSYTKILETQSPLNNLKKGYGLIYKDDIPVKNYSFTVGETAKIVTLHQEMECEVKKVKPRKV